MNSRMVQATFDDLNPETVGRWAYPDTKKWDADRNTREFVAAMPEWRKHGLLAVTLNLQGGSPRGTRRTSRGTTRRSPPTARCGRTTSTRLAKVLDKADELGMVVILGIFYFGQDERLKDEDAVKRGVDNALDWLAEKGYRNVLIEINNECNVRYDHAILKPDRVHELIERAKKHPRQVPRRHELRRRHGAEGERGQGVRLPAAARQRRGEPERIAEMVRQTRKVPGYRPMPILFNEDDHFDFDKPANNFVAAVGEYASWGYFDYRMKGEGFDDGYQSVPVNWGISQPAEEGVLQAAERDHRGEAVTRRRG